MKALKLFVAAAALLSSIAASAQTCDAGGLAGPPNPSFSDISVSPGSMIGCIGFFNQNQFDAESDVTKLNAWLSTKGQAPLAYSVNPGGEVQVQNLGTTSALGGTGDNQLSFGKTIYGETLIGMHWGNYGSNTGSNVTAFYLFDAGSAGLDSITVNVTGGWSNGFLYVTGPIPEPETYALMLAGLGAVGFMARRRKAAAATPKAV